MLLLMPLAAWLVLRALLAPLPGEWTTQLRLGPLQIEAGVPSLVRLATSHWVAPRLDGLQWRTRAGPLHLRWLKDSQALAVRCAPCTLRLRGLGDEPLVLPALDITVQRDFDELQGLVEAGGAGSVVRGSWQGELSARQIRLALDIPMTPLADGYALFAAHVPELAQARIEGRFALRARAALPNGEVQLMPRVEGLAVSGLGTAALANAASACPAPQPAQPIDPRGWLARAVIAAEDQRFWEHPGYDLAELGAAFDANQRAERIARGGSTLSQQLAKLLVTGAERTPARKLRELLYAADMEQSLGKARILALYLENAPWGPGTVCGAHAAAQYYFGTSVRKLQPAQAVWLAAMLHNPELEASRWARRGQIDVVRAQWVARGVQGLSRQERARLAQGLVQAALWNVPALPAGEARLIHVASGEGGR
ncbi:MAG: transglycosylase domain-containing protein [Burkholderiaceae bacterium]|nr:transglycosylase domain-containing protein [Burkholderiaceae bacterium]